MPPKDLEARKAYHREYVKRHEALYKESRKRSAKLHEQKMRALVDSFKDAPCMDCGERWPPVAMDFDHVRGQKIMNVSQLYNNKVSVETVKAEIAKCDLVCACCHRIRTQKRNHGR